MCVQISQKSSKFDKNESSDAIEQSALLGYRFRSNRLGKAHAICGERVLHRGTLDDFRKIIAYDGSERLSEIIRGLRYIGRKPMYFASAYYGTLLEEMRCYIIRQSEQIHWGY